MRKRAKRSLERFSEEDGKLYGFQENVVMGKLNSLIL